MAIKKSLEPRYLFKEKLTEKYATRRKFTLQFVEMSISL